MGKPFGVEILALSRSGVCPRMSQRPNGEATSILPGMPLANVNGIMLMASASSEVLAKVSGVSTSIVAPTLPTRAAFYGVVEADTADWDAVTGGSGGLEPGLTYFLDVGPGMITTTAPTADGLYVVGLGQALDAMTLLLAITAPILL